VEKKTLTQVEVRDVLKVVCEARLKDGSQAAA